MIINLHVSEFTGRTDDKPRGKIKQRASEVQVQRQQHAPVTSLNSIHHRWQKMEIHIRKSQRREGGRRRQKASVYARVFMSIHMLHAQLTAAFLDGAHFTHMNTDI